MRECDVLVQFCMAHLIRDVKFLLAPEKRDCPPPLSQTNKAAFFNLRGYAVSLTQQPLRQPRPIGTHQ
ncbi:MAG TPA: hypothetical protein PK770_00055 [Kiritimatiellia bacterium]|nr:hypothetical protein [Kiritimatiellia bacterium]